MEKTMLGTLHQALLTKMKTSTEGGGWEPKQASLRTGERAVSLTRARGSWTDDTMEGEERGSTWRAIHTGLGESGKLEHCRLTYGRRIHDGDASAAGRQLRVVLRLLRESAARQRPRHSADLGKG